MAEVSLDGFPDYDRRRVGDLSRIIDPQMGPAEGRQSMNTIVARLAGNVPFLMKDEPVVGARLIVSRRGYKHHGIYSGDGRVIHYAGRVRYQRGRIEEISLRDFVGNRPVYSCRAPGILRAEEIVRRARSRLGECRYDLFTNNCEHFCNWCQLGEPRSQQIESLTRPARMLVRAAVTVASLLQPWVSHWRSTTF